MTNPLSGYSISRLTPSLDLSNQQINIESKLLEKLLDGVSFEGVYTIELLSSRLTEKDTLILDRALLQGVEKEELTPYLIQLLPHLIKNGFDLNQKIIIPKTQQEVQESNTQTLLHLACLYSREELFEFLLKEPKVHINALNRYLETPFLICCRKNNQKFCEKLLKRKELDACAPDSNDKNALEFVCEMGLIGIVKKIISSPHRDDLFYSSVPHKPSPLVFAIENRQLETVKDILSNAEKAFTKTGEGRKFLVRACSSGDADLVKFLLTQNVDPNCIDPINSTHPTPLISACKNKRKDLVDLLLKHKKIDPNLSTQFCAPPLHISCQNEDVEAVRALLAHEKTDPNKQDMLKGRPLDIAIRNKNIEIISMLLEHEELNPNKIENIYSYIFLTKNDDLTIRLFKKKNLGLNNYIYRANVLEQTISKGSLSDIKILLHILLKKAPELFLKERNTIITETSELFQNRISNQYPQNLAFADFWSQFSLAPLEVTNNLRDWDPIAKYMKKKRALKNFLYMVLCSDDYIKIKDQHSINLQREDWSNINRFITIAKELPLELQMVLARRSAQLPGENIPSKDINSKWRKTLEEIE
jgi:ankyrin repeat protein